MEISLYMYCKFQIGTSNVIDKTMISDWVSSSKKGFKYFIGCKENEKVKPLCVMPPKMSIYAKNVDEANYMFFFNGRWGVYSI